MEAMRGVILTILADLLIEALVKRLNSCCKTIDLDLEK